MRFRSLLSLAVSAAVFCGASNALADMPAAEEFKERVPIEEPIVETCGWGTRVSTGVAIHFFKDEDTEAMPGGYLDVFHCETPLNYRIGIEGRHFDIDQTGADQYAEFTGKATELSYFRIPLSVEYMTPIAEATTLYLGLGPDLIRTANDLSDFTVGLHLSARIGYNITDAISLAVEGGYQWAEVSDSGPDMDLSGAYVTPTIGYQF